jgi:hypothetical protein
MMFFGSGQRWHRQRKHRDNGNTASNLTQHADLSFFELGNGVGKFDRRQGYQIACGRVSCRRPHICVPRHQAAPL